ncbi:hypothetical protein IGI04_024432 [Brassica rapa subsp. trilocularis]|uniref:Uncharacterized protein n=1 Tax=Brassica rapa subsp. trilocularis TaxID=1813537 RepID=A0ABQ7MA46_BRACM|nr:hypothetical protein IGI04_024432 [Brassica rapa subsp. trilocularis]
MILYTTAHTNSEILNQTNTGTGEDLSTIETKRWRVNNHEPEVRNRGVATERDVERRRGNSLNERHVSQETFVFVLN